MHILHARYTPEDPGLTFWVENADAPPPKPQPHPFCLSSKELRHNLAAVRGVPLPSPQLIHNWELDS